MFKIWIILFVAFITYTCGVYYYCDKNTNEKVPDKHVLAGWDTWQKNNCQTCHQLYGLGGFLGPDLTNVASDPAKNEKYLSIFMKYGTGKMPNLNLSDSEVNNLVSFLKWVDKSGKNRVPKEKVTWSGNYNLEN